MELKPLKEYYATIKFVAVVQVEDESQIPDEIKDWFDDIYGIDFDYDLTWEPIHVCNHQYDSYCSECGLPFSNQFLTKKEI